MRILVRSEAGEQRALGRLVGWLTRRAGRRCGRGSGLRRRGGGRHDRAPCAEPRRPFLTKPAEAQEVQQRQQARGVDRGGVDPAPVVLPGHVAVVLQPDQRARQRQLVPTCLDRFAPLGREVGQVLEHAFDGAVLHHELRGRLGSNARYARHVVDRVAHEREHVDHVLGPHALAVEEPLGREFGAGLHVVQHRAGIEELRQVLVLAGDPDRRLGMLAPHPTDERRDDVVGLDAPFREDGDARQARQLEAPLDLTVEVLGRRLAMRLVLGVELGPEGLGVAAGIDHERHVRASAVAQELQQHLAEAVDHVGRLVRDGAVEPAADRVVRAEELRVAIDDAEAIGHVRRPRRPHEGRAGAPRVQDRARRRAEP